LTTENRLFVENAPISAIQNLITAVDPALLTEHSLMLLFHDLSRLLPIEELPQRLLEAFSVYMTESDQSDEEEHPTH
jgi:hypothetical protein